MTANKSLKTFIIKQTKKDETNRSNANHTGSLTFLHHLETKLPMQAGDNLKKRFEKCCWDDKLCYQ